MGKLILVRHGESEANRQKIFAEDDSPLTEKGREQAREVAEKIAERFQLAAAVASALPRAAETARIVAARLGVPLEIVPDLHERDFGSLKGKSYVDFSKWIRNDSTYDAARPWLWTPQGGESMEDAKARVVGALEKLRRRHPEDEVLVVCHGVVMQVMWAFLTGTWEGAEIPENCGVVQVEHTEQGFGMPLLLEDCSVTRE